MNPTTPTSSPIPRFESRDAFLVFGLSEHYARGTNAGIPSQWSRFGPHIGQIDGQIPYVSYGVVYNADPAGNFDYLCAVEVPRFPDHPAEFTRLTIPRARYAVFTHTDHISSIQATLTAIWDHGLAKAGVRPADGPTFERYDQSFDPGTGLGGLEIWVPIKE
jgi:AraC family transcriptional regulator